MKTIIISDLHQRHNWIEKFLEKTPHDEVVFLGDYFDDFDDTPEETKETAKWLKKSLKIPNRIHLLGNHDSHYRFPGLRKWRCALDNQETQEKKEKAISAIMSPQDWEKIIPSYQTQGWLLSHAGVPKGTKNAEKILKTDIKFAKRGVHRKTLKTTIWGKYRDFIPTRHLNQIFGHSPSEKIRRKVIFGDLTEKENNRPTRLQQEESWEQDGTIIASFQNYPRYIASDNWCIDTNNSHIGIITDGKFKIIKNPSRIPTHRPPSQEYKNRAKTIKDFQMFKALCMWGEETPKA